MNRSEAGKLGYLKSKNAHKKRYEKLKQKYNSNPKFCPFCKICLLYEKRKNKFCSHSCAAAYNNKGIRRHGLESKNCAHCNKKARRQNKYCDECIKKGLSYNTKNNIKEIKDPSTLRAYLLRTRPYSCEICEIKEWNNKPVPLEVDHIDGNSDNNIKENVRLLCSNCHMQLPTSKGRNRGNGRSRQKMKNKRYELGLKY